MEENPQKTFFNSVPADKITLADLQKICKLGGRMIEIKRYANRELQVRTQPISR